MGREPGGRKRPTKSGGSRRWQWVASQIEPQRAVDAQQFVDAIEILEQAQRRADEPVLAALLTVAHCRRCCRAGVSPGNNVCVHRCSEPSTRPVPDVWTRSRAGRRGARVDAERRGSVPRVIRSCDRSKPGGVRALDEDAGLAVRAARREFDEADTTGPCATARVSASGHAAIPGATRVERGATGSRAAGGSDAQRLRVSSNTGTTRRPPKSGGLVGCRARSMKGSPRSQRPMGT